MNNMQKMKKGLAILLTVAMLCSILPMSAFAAAMNSTVPQTSADGLQMRIESDRTTYNLWVGGEQFASDKLTINGTIGTATYNPQDNTLTLNNYTTAAVYEWQTSSNTACRAAIYYGDTDELTLEFEGTNKVTGQGEDKSYGIYSTASINISGSGNLIAEGSSDGVYANGNITVLSGKLTGNSNGTGVRAEVDINVSGTGELEGNGNIYGVQTDGNISISGNGSLTATNGDASMDDLYDSDSGSGILMGKERKITISDDGRMHAVGVNYGVHNTEGSLRINGGHVVLQGRINIMQGSLGCGKGYIRMGHTVSAVITPDSTFSIWDGNLKAGEYFEFVGMHHAAVAYEAGMHKISCSDTSCPVKLTDIAIDSGVISTISGDTANHWTTNTHGDKVNPETHTDADSNRKCDVCGLLYGGDVYVAGKWLQSGQYMDANGSITTAQPDDGYAYYHDGVLELHNYSYTGVVQDLYSRYVDEDDDDYYTAVIFSKDDITIKVYGLNQLFNNYAAHDEVDGTEYIGDGIVSGGNITIIGASDARNDVLLVQGSFGIITEYGNIEISNLKDLNIYTIRYDGIYSYGDILIHDNDNVTVNAHRDGIYTMHGDISIQGTPKDYAIPKIDIKADNLEHYTADKTYAIFASKDADQGTPSIRIGDKLAITSPDDGRICEPISAMDWEVAYTYVTIHDADGTAAKEVAIKPLIYMVSINDAHLSLPVLPEQSMKDTYGEEYITEIVESSRPEEGNYTFAGWYTDAAFTTAYDMAQPVHGDITLYAKWEAANTGGGGSYTPSVSDKVEVTVPDTMGDDVKVEAETITTSTLNVVKDIAANDDNLAIIGGKDSAIQIVAKEDGKPLDSFTQPVSITVPVSKSALKDVADTGKLTLALVTEDENGEPVLTYVGGKYDADKGTITAYTDKPGNYVLVEKADLIKIELTIDHIVATMNDKPVVKDVPSRIVGDRTLVPARFVLENLNCGVDWNGDTRTVIVTLPNGEKLYMPVDEPIPGFGTAPIIEEGRTLVPIAYIADAMDAYVVWVEDARQVIIVK